MSNLVEIYVEYDEGLFDRLDTFDDENISLKFKLKDSSDLSKVFSTFSQTFTVPTSDKNNRLLNYYFNTEVVRKSNRYIKAKIYINKQLFKLGFISINEGKFKMGRNSSYSINFFTTLFNLKELYGDETLSQTLQNEDYTTEWNDARCFLYSQGLVFSSTFLPDVIVPLSSNKRVWSYDAGTGDVNNIRYTGTNVGVKSIEPNELRPAIPFFRVLNAIASSKGLTFKSELFSKDEYKKLYVYCNSNNNKGVVSNVRMEGFFTGTNSSPWNVTRTGDTLKIRILYSGNYTTTRFSSIFFEIFPIKIFKSDIDISIKVRFIKDSDDTILSEQVMRVFPSQNNLYSSILNLDSVTMGINNTTPFDIRVEIEPNQYIYWEVGNFDFKALNADLTINNFIENTNIDLLSLLPNIKTVDFITSFIKLFNLSIVENEVIGDVNIPTESNVVNFVPRNEFFNEIKDYTEFTEIGETTIKPISLYKNILFKHKTSKYLSNESFKIAVVEREFGELKFQPDNPLRQLKDEYKIETDFSIVPNTIINNTIVQTFYGFKSNSEVDATYGTLYEPNTEDFTLFYYNGQKNLFTRLDDTTLQPIEFNFKVRSGGATTIERLKTYNKVSIVYSDDPNIYLNSLGYSVEVDLVDTSFQFNKNLYSNYYKNEIDRIYNNNTRLFTYDLVLPLNAIVDFDMTSSIKIKDKLYSVEEADINVVTGKAKLTLMNFAPAIYDNVFYLPKAPTTFTGILL